MSQQKTRLVQVVLNLPEHYQRNPEWFGGPDNIVYRQMMAYYDHEKRQWTWVDEFDKVQSGKSYSKETKIKMLILSMEAPSYNVSISPMALDSEISEKESLISWLERWPLLAHATVGSKVDSFPTKNHRVQFQNFYNSANPETLPINLQPFKLVDNSKVEKVKNENLKRDMELVKALNTLEQSEETITKFAYVLGLNPAGMESFEIQNTIYEHIKISERYDEFFQIYKEKAWDDIATYATSLGLAYDIITKSNTGIYQFDGKPITESKSELAYYFRSNENAYNHLRILLKERTGQDLSATTTAAPKKTKGRATSAVEQYASTEKDADLEV